MTITFAEDGRISSQSVLKLSRNRSTATEPSRRSHRTVARTRQTMFGAVIGLGIALAACGGGKAIDLSPVATKVQVAQNGFSFPNFPATAYKDEFDASDVTNMFGSGPAVCASGRGESCQLTAEAAAFARMVNQSRASGHCEGLAAVALTRFDSSANPPTVKLPDQDETIHAIMRAFATQFVPEAQADVEKWLGKSLDEKISALVESFKTGKLDYTLGVYVPQGGHALLPYAVEFPSKDNARIMVYDTNWPGKNRYIDVDLKAKKWKFSFSGADPENDPDIWTGGPADMDLTAFETRSGTCPFCGDGTKTSTTTMLVRTTNLNWSVEANGQVLKPGGTVQPGSGVVVKPVKGLNIPGAGGLFSAAQDRSAYDYLIRIPNTPAKTGQKKARSKLKFSGTTSLFAVTPTGIAQVNTPGNPNIPVEVGETSIVSKDPAVQLTLASGNLVATASGPGAVLETSASGTVEVTVTTASGQVVKQEVTPEAPAAKVTADATGGVTALVAAASGEVVKREVSSTGVETKTTTTESLDLNATSFKAPAGLESKPIEALPSLEKRNLANPEYKADAPYVAPTTTTSIQVKNKALEPTKTTLSKFIIDAAVFGDAPFVVDEPTSNSNAPFTYSSSDTSVATVNATTGKVTVVGAGTTSITASQEASPQFTAGSISASLKVAKATPKLGTLVLPKKTFGDEPFAVKAPTSTSPVDFVFDSSNESVAKISTSGRLTVVGAGTTNITVTQAANANYESATLKVPFTVGKGSLTFASSVLEDVTFGAADFNLTPPTSASTGAISYASNTPEIATVDAATGRVRIVGAGAASLRILQAASTNFDASVQTVTFNVKRAVPTLTLTAPSNKPYGAPDFALSVPTTNSSGVVTYTSVTPNVATVNASTGVVHLVGTGTVTIQVSVAATNNFESRSNTISFNALKALPTYGSFTLNSVVATTNTVQITPPASTSDAAFSYVSSDTSVATVNSSTGIVTIVSAGTTNITASQTGNSLYEAGSVSAALTVTRATPVFGQFAMSAHAYGDAPFVLVPPMSTSNGAFTFTSNNSAVATVTTNGTVTITGAGTVVITATQAQTGVYNSAYSVVTLNIAQAMPTYGAFSIADRDSDGATFTPTVPTSTSSAPFTYTSSNTSVATVNSSTGAITVVAPGTTVITASQSATANYAASSVSAPFTVMQPVATLGTFVATANSASPGLKGTRYVGYFNDNPQWFATAPLHGDTNVISDFSNFTSNADFYSWEWTGNFVVPSTGSYEFCTTSDDASFLWLGSNATTGFTVANSLVNNAGLHGMSRRCGTTSLTAGQNLPIRIQFGENGGGDAIQVSYAINGGNAVFNGTGQYFSQMPSRMGDPNYTISHPTSNSPGAFTYTSSNPAVATVNSITGEVSILSAGTTTFTATQAAAGSYRATSVSKTVTFDKGIQAALSAVPTTCALGGTCVVGDTGPGGGTVVYVDTNTFTSGAACGSECTYIEVAPVNWNGASSDTNNQFAWDCAGTALTSTGTAIGAGYANTATITSNCSQTSGAAAVVRASTYGNQNDWYIPSTSELAAIYGQRAFVADYQSGGYYWSSTEASATGAYQQRGSTSTNIGKSTMGIVRPVRAFKANGLTVPFRDLSVALIPQGGSGTGARTIQLFDAGSASCTLNTSTNTITASMSGTCKIKVARAEDANWQASLSNAVTVSFYGPAFSNVSVGVYDSCGVNVQGGVSCWGWGDWGLLGDGRRTNTFEPVTVTGLTSGVTSLAAGQHHNCALLGDGSVKCWGYGDNGQLGNGTTGQYNSPVDATTLNFKAKQIVAGHQHTCALTVTGGVKCWGWNGYGQLGDGSTQNRFTPVDAIGLTSGVVQISANFANTCAVLENGNTKCWGRGDYGQIGDGFNAQRNVPTLVPGIEGLAKSVASGVFNTCIITTSNTLKCWGHNGWGDLGIGSNTSTNTPVTVPGVTNVAKLSIGEGSMCALNTSGALQCWGRNENGQLGDGTLTNRNTPITPIGMSSRVSDVSLGIFQHACAVLDGGTVKCWGYNDHGQIGDGSQTRRLTPTNVLRALGAHQTATTLGALSLPGGNIDVNTAPFTLATPSASRAGTVTFVSSNPSVATVNAVTGQVTVVAPGRSYISAVMAGNGSYSTGTSTVAVSVRPSNPQNLTDCQLALSCNLGDIGPAGGRIVYVDTNDVFVGIDYIEGAPSDASASQWCDSANNGNFTYGSQNTEIGMYNMQAELALCSSGAARAVRAYSSNGYTDWHLPTEFELQKVFTTFSTPMNVGSPSNSVTALVPNTKYWTSYENGGPYAHATESTTRATTVESKSNTFKVRAVRAFTSIYTPKISTSLQNYNLNTGSYEYTHAPFDVSRPTSLSAGVVTFVSSAANIASVHEYAGTVTNNFTGSVRFTATQASWAGFTGSTATADYTVAPSTPSISGFTAPNGSLNSSSAPFTLSIPQSQSPAAFTFTSSNTAVATVNSVTGQVTIVGAGQTIITAAQAANMPWNAASTTVLINVAKSCADGGACVLGDIGPGGGKIFYVASSKQSWGRYLEAAPADISATQQWCEASQDTLGARDTAIGTGQSNTTAIDTACTAGAAQAAADYVVNGKTDWHLPSLDELQEMYNNRNVFSNLTIDNNISYWSSTEENSNYAKRIGFANGGMSGHIKTQYFAVRPIRYVQGPPDGLTALTAGTSATQLMLDNGYTGTGNYFIKPQGYSGQAVQLWCDFTHLGGGWVLIGKGRQSNDSNGGWFGTESAIDTTGLLQANAANAGISKVSSEFVNYLMNGSANGWVNANSNNFMVANRISNAADGYSGVGDSWTIKITNETAFKWVNQFGSVGMNAQSQTGYGKVERWDNIWTAGSRTYSWDNIRLNDMGDNDARRLFTWHWDGHGAYHGWSSGNSENRGFMNGGENHPLQFVQLWAR